MQSSFHYVEQGGCEAVVYRVGLFQGSGDEAAAEGRFVHVYVDRDTRRPVKLPPALLAALAPLHRTMA